MRTSIAKARGGGHIKAPCITESMHTGGRSGRRQHTDSVHSPIKTGMLPARSIYTRSICTQSVSTVRSTMSSSEGKASAAFTESTQANAIPIRADAQGHRSIHTRGLRGILNRAGVRGSRSSGLRSQDPERAVISQNRVRIHNGVGKVVLIISITPPDYGSVNRRVIIFVNDFFAGALFYPSANVIIHIVVPHPFLDNATGMESEFFRFLGRRISHNPSITTQANSMLTRCPSASHHPRHRRPDRTGNHTCMR